MGILVTPSLPLQSCCERLGDKTLKTASRVPWCTQDSCSCKCCTFISKDHREGFGIFFFVL